MKKYFHSVILFSGILFGITTTNASQEIWLNEVTCYVSYSYITSKGLQTVQSSEKTTIVLPLVYQPGDSSPYSFSGEVRLTPGHKLKISGARLEPSSTEEKTSLSLLIYLIRELPDGKIQILGEERAITDQLQEWQDSNGKTAKGLLLFPDANNVEVTSAFFNLPGPYENLIKTGLLHEGVLHSAGSSCNLRQKN